MGFLMVGGFYSENAMRKARKRARCILDTKAKLGHSLALYCTKHAAEYILFIGIRTLCQNVT